MYMCVHVCVSAYVCTNFVGTKRAQFASSNKVPPSKDGSKIMDVAVQKGGEKNTNDLQRASTEDHFSYILLMHNCVSLTATR
jgi:hypothetical protein